MNKDTVKQVLVLRKDLNMRKGKMVVQGAHAAMLFLLDKKVKCLPLTDVENAWLLGNMTKVCLGVPTLDELISLHEQALTIGIPSFLMEDEGFTEFHNQKTITALAIGPWDRNEIDKVTGHLNPL